MFTASSAIFIYCVSPVHMGAGTAIGLIDNPIQRERHTDYPVMAGSGLKGAVRHSFHSRQVKDDLVNRLFGPETGASEFAGAISFGDAQLVAFPVRSVKNAFIYATAPTALAKAARLLALLGKPPSWPVPVVEADDCKLVNPNLLDNGKLQLEAFEFNGHTDDSLKEVGDWLSQQALPQDSAYEFFRNKLKHDLALLTDEAFGYLIRNATVVEPHVCIDNERGAAKDTGLFYTENLPPESLLLAPVMASVERSPREQKQRMSAETVLNTVLYGDGDGLRGLSGQLLQIGGDATTGRGQVMINAVGGPQ